MSNILTYDGLNITPIQLISVDYDDDYDVKTVPKVSGESYVIKFGKSPREINTRIRFNYYNTYPVMPDTLANSWYTKADDSSVGDFILANVNYGEYIIKRIKTTRSNFLPIVIDLQINFIHITNL